ncbi:hypothetical protein FRC11_014459, partial [Ceratobasidium sp. 423]
VDGDLPLLGQTISDVYKGPIDAMTFDFFSLLFPEVKFPNLNQKDWESDDGSASEMLSLVVTPSILGISFAAAARVIATLATLFGQIVPHSKTGRNPPFL